jgi:hypothetical protein
MANAEFQQSYDKDNQPLILLSKINNLTYLEAVW